MAAPTFKAGCARHILVAGAGLQALQTAGDFTIILEARRGPEDGSRSRWQGEAYQSLCLARRTSEFPVGKAAQERMVDI